MAALAVKQDDLTDPRFGLTPGLRELVLGTGEDGTARLEFWARATGGKAAGNAALELQLARDIFAQRPAVSAAEMLALRGPMLATAASALRGAAQIRANGPGDALVTSPPPDYLYRGFFAIARAELSHRKFNGTMTPPLQREAIISVDAVTLLPYDPVHDHVLLVEQFRVAPWIRGEARPWLIEAVAGRLDGGETPEAAARREAEEEAGITIGEIFQVADFYPSPGAFTEYIWSLVGIASLPEGRGGVFGLESEGEDILTHVIPFDEAMVWLAEGRLANAPLILSLLWLARERPALRRAAGVHG